MRILLVSNLYAPYIMGGAEIAARNYATRLEQFGHEIVVLTSSYGLDEPRHEGSIRRVLRYIPGHYWSYHYRANAALLQRTIDEVQPDVLYVWEIEGLGLIPMLSVLNAAPVPIVYQQQSYWLQYALQAQKGYTRVRYRWIKKLLIGAVPFPRYTSMITVSAAVKEEYVRLGCDAGRIEVIYNAISDSFFTTPLSREHYLQSGRIRLAYIGRLYSAKGVLVLLKALDMLVHGQKDIQFSLDIFGEGDAKYTKELHSFVQEKRLETVVTFHGKVSQGELIQKYDQADIVVIPSIWKEPGCAIIMEAMARGVPLIGTNIGGTPEMVAHGADGLLIEPGDETALASAILRLASDSALRAKLAVAARATAQKRYTVEGTARRIEQHLQRVIESESCKALNASQSIRR